MIRRLYILTAAAIYRLRHPGKRGGCRHAELMAEVDRIWGKGTRT
jgi:hypothetical protein